MPISKIKTSSILADAASTNLNIDAGTLFLDATNNNVGIGNTSPASYNASSDNLVIGTSGSNGMTIVSGSTSSGYIMFADGTTGQQAYEGQITYDHTSNFMAFNTTAAERMRIDSSGNVGIGVTSPASRLHVNHPTGSTNAIAQFTNGTTGSTAGNGLYVGIDSSNDATAFNFYNSPMKFGTNGTERMRIDTSGNVGIGTTSPGSAVGGKCLTIYNLNHATLSIQAVDGGNDRSATLELLSSGNGGSYSQILYGDTDTTPGTTSPLVFASYHSAVRTERMRINANGNVGIGDSSASTKLSVGGSNTSLLSNQTSVYAPSANSAATSIKLFNDSATNGAYASLEFWVRNANNNINIAYIASPSISTNDSGTLAFGRRTGDNTSVESMRITSNNELVVNGNLIATGITYTSGFYFTGGGTQNILTIGAGEAYLFYSVYASYGAGDHRHGIYYLAAVSTQASSGVQISALSGTGGFSISAGVVSYSAGGGNPATTIWWQRLS
jgi:hypothetical protein